VLVEGRHGLPLASQVSAASVHDVNMALSLVDAVPAIAGQVGAPIKKPGRVMGDKGYDAEWLRVGLEARNITPVLARRGCHESRELQEGRWMVERTIAWIKRFRRLAIRYDRSAQLHHAFLTLACVLINHDHWVRFC
jgi:transposase